VGHRKEPKKTATAIKRLAGLKTHKAGGGLREKTTRTCGALWVTRGRNIKRFKSFHKSPILQPKKRSGGGGRTDLSGKEGKVIGHLRRLAGAGGGGVPREKQKGGHVMGYDWGTRKGKKFTD